MTKTYRQGAIGALLDEYELAILHLKKVIEDISNEELVKIVDTRTNDSNCKSIQTILSHVVNSGYRYAFYIRQLPGGEIDFPGKQFRLTIHDYLKDLDSFFNFTTETFKTIEENQLEQLDNSKKLITSWGQLYDIEQITEHAIVHILRHRRQIEKFKIALQGGG